MVKLGVGQWCVKINGAAGVYWLWAKWLGLLLGYIQDIAIDIDIDINLDCVCQGAQ